MKCVFCGKTIRRNQWRKRVGLGEFAHSKCVEEALGTAMSEKEFLYIVDWDIPEHPASSRSAFYRALKKLRKERGIYGAMSTQSVLITNNRELATAVHSLASQYGRSHLYKAVEEI